MLDDLKGPDLVVGIKQSTEAVSDGTAKQAYVARDADEHVIAPFIRLCQENLVPITYAESKEQLGKACGIKVGAACAVKRMERYAR